MVIVMIGDFFKIYYAPDSVLDKIIRQTKGVVSTMTKMMIGFGLTMISSILAFIGVFVLEIYFLFTGAIKFGLSLMLNPFLAAIIIPIFFWIIDTILLIIGVLVVGSKPNILGLMNIRAFSMAPIPIKVLYVFYTTKAISLGALLGLPTSIISWLITIWSIVLLARGVKKFFELDWARSFVVAIIPFLVRVLIFSIGYLL